MKQVQWMIIRFSGFDWNSGNRRKVLKHGVTIAEIEGLFAAEVLMMPDHRHSSEEERFLAVGESPQGRCIFVSFTFRSINGDQLIRVISARYMHKKERRVYEELKKSI